MSNPDFSRLDLNLILVFDALLKYRHVTKTAAALHVTQSAISHSLARLRLFFDDALFVRGATGVTPTIRALELSTTVREISSLVRTGLLSQGNFIPEAASRTFTICMTDLGELTLLPTLMAALAQVSPGCTLNTVQRQASDVLAMLENGDVDLAISAPPSPGDSEIFAQKLYTHSNIVIAHESAGIGETLDLDRYCDMPQVAIRPRSDVMTVIDQALAGLGRQRRIVLTTEHHLIIPHLIMAQPSLIATAPVGLGKACQIHGALRLYPPPVVLPNYDVHQYWHARFHKDRFHVWFRGLVAQFFQDSVPFDLSRATS